MICNEDSNLCLTLKTVEPALDLIRTIPKKIAVLAICGPYRTGKSYFVSQLLGDSAIFQVGHRTSACTHGVWMATCILECDDYAVVVLDMEGTGAVGKDETEKKAMNGLLVMTTLISSYLIYNSKNVPDAGNLDDIT